MKTSSNELRSHTQKIISIQCMLVYVCMHIPVECSCVSMDMCMAQDTYKGQRTNSYAGSCHPPCLWQGSFSDGSSRRAAKRS